MEKRIVVMGATSGIGLEVARLFAQKGWKVGIAGRRTDRLEALSKSTPGIVAYKSIDVMSEDAPERLLSLIADMGGMDLYFHSSGIGWQNNALHPDKELLTVQTNALGFTRMLTTAFNFFATRSGGHIACITSIAGTKGLGAAPAYSATKRYQSHYLECLSQQSRMRHLHIRVTDIRPGFVDTPLIEGSSYPLKLTAASVAASIVRAIERKREVVIIDRRYCVLVFLWRLIPRALWVRMPIGQKDGRS